MLAHLIAIANRHRAGLRVHTAVPRLVIWSAEAPTEPIPALFEPTFYMMLQGRKRLTFAGKTSDFCAGSCCIASVGLPFLSQVTDATPEAPYIGVNVMLDAGVIASLMMDMPDRSDDPVGAISMGKVEESILEPLGRLLGLLDTPADIPVLAPQFERELFYRLLQGPMGPRLRQMGHNGARFSQIKIAADWICEHAEQPMSVTKLAESVGMSVTSFHRHFKAITGHSPLAYQRYIRLLDARGRLASGAGNVTSVAFATGYASASQFSREYKKAFGVPPVVDAALLRQ